jgi:hypothetical protein
MADGDAQQPSATDTSGISRQLREARETMDNAGGIFGTIMGFIPWILIALVALPFISMIPGIRESGFGQWVRGMVDQGMMMAENMTNGGLFSGTTQRVLDAATPENRANILEQGGLPEAAAAYIADNANYTAIKAAVGGNIRTLSTAAGMAQLIERAPTHARGLIDAFARGRATATTTTALPPAITGLLQDQTAFARLMGNAKSRGVILHAVEVLGPRREGSTTEPMMTSAQLEGLLSGATPALSVEDFRSLAVRALRGENISADVARLAGVIAATAPVADVAAQIVPETASAEVRGNVERMITDLRAHFTTEQVTTITASLTGTGAINPIAIIQSMYAANAEGANAFLSNADNLAAINALISARTPATTTEPTAPQPLATALLGNATGRTAIAGLVRDLAAIDPQAPAQLMTILAMPANNPNEVNARNTQLLRLLNAGGDATKAQGYIAAFTSFSQGISGIDAPAGSELDTLKTTLSTTMVGLTPPRLRAVADAAENAPALLGAVDRIRANSTRLEFGLVEALMNDEDRRGLLGRNAQTGAENSVQPLGDVLRSEARNTSLDANTRAALNMLTQRFRVNNVEGYHNLAAVVNLVERLDTITGQEAGQNEQQADQQNARMLSFVVGMMNGEKIHCVNPGASNSELRFRLDSWEYTPGGATNQTVSATEIATFFRNDSQRAAIYSLINTMQPAAGEAGAFLRFLKEGGPGNNNWWRDSNRDGTVSRDTWLNANEGFVQVLMDANAIGYVLRSRSDAHNGHTDYVGAVSAALIGNRDILDRMSAMAPAR